MQAQAQMLHHNLAAQYCCGTHLRDVVAVQCGGLGGQAGGHVGVADARDGAVLHNLRYQADSKRWSSFKHV